MIRTWFEYLIIGAVLAWYGLCLAILLCAGIRLNRKGETK